MGSYSTHTKFVVGAIVVTIALAGCPAPGDGGPGALKIGALLPLTGDLGVFGPSGLNAAELAVQQINDEGGVNGQDVVIVSGDTQTRQSEAPGEASRLINVEGVNVIIGAYSSGVSLSFIDQAVQAQVPMMSPANTAPTFTDYADDGYYFRTAPSDVFQAAVMAQLVIDQNFSRAAILAVNNDYGVGFGDVFEEEFEDVTAGRIITDYVKYDPEGTTFDSDVQDATGQGDATEDPEVVVFVGYPESGSVILRTAHEQGVAGPDADIAWRLSEGVFSGSFPDAVGQTEDDRYIVENMTGTTPEVFLEEGITPDFAMMYQAEYGESPSLFAPGAYDAAVLFSLAAEKCGCNDGPGIRDALFDIMNPPGDKVGDVSTALQMVRDGEDIDYSGAAGDIDWTEAGDPTTGIYAIYRFTADGGIAIDETGIQVGG